MEISFFSNTKSSHYDFFYFPQLRETEFVDQRKPAKIFFLLISPSLVWTFIKITNNDNNIVSLKFGFPAEKYSKAFSITGKGHKNMKTEKRSRKILLAVN